MTKLDKANEYLKRKELKEAQAVLEELLQEEPNNGDALYNLGMIYTELGQPEKAVKTLQRCIDSGQDTANVYVALGYAHSKLGNQNKARELFLSALEIEPDNPYALRNIGDMQMANRWAQFLELSDWFKWRGFEDVPQGYINET